MKRLLPVLALISVLSGPLLRGSEAADDLARSLAELVQGQLLEEIDGGVGDDPGVAVLASSVGLARDRSGSLWLLDVGAMPPSGILRATHVPCAHDPPPCPAVHFSLPIPARLAWLQRFLF